MKWLRAKLPLGLTVLTIAASLITSSLIVAFTPAVSGASAYGCAVGNPNTGPDMYCVLLDGSGNYVDHVTGTFRGSALVHSYHITAEFFDAHWNWYQTLESSTTNASVTGETKVIGVHANKRTGYMCSTLHYLDGFSKPHTMSVCHQIHP